MNKSVWETLSPINVNDHTEKKGQFTYLAWTFAWAAVKEKYPGANYRLLEDVHYPSGTMEVRCEVTINELTHPMWLPVTDHNNRAIKEPDAFAVNTARMRCLVKCLAMFGLGHYIYAGESLPTAPKATDAEWKELLDLVGKEDAMGVRLFADRVGPDIMTELFNAAKAKQKMKFKEQVREMYRKSNEIIEKTCAAIETALSDNDPSVLAEVAIELRPEEWRYVYASLGDTTTHAMQKMAADQDIEVPSE